MEIVERFPNLDGSSAQALRLLIQMRRQAESHLLYTNDRQKIEVTWDVMSELDKLIDRRLEELCS